MNPKPKKKWVKKQDVESVQRSFATQLNQHSNYNSQKSYQNMARSEVYQFQPDRLDRSIKSQSTMSLLKVSNFDSDDDQQTIYFQFDDRKLIHLWLVGILPGQKKQKYTIDLNKRKFTGSKKDCQKKLSQCNQHLKNYKMKLVSKLQNQLHRNTQLFLQISQVKVFAKDLILQVCQQIFQKYRYQNIKKITQHFQGKFYYLFSLKNQMQNKFIQWIQHNRQRHISRAEIQQIKGKKSIFLQDRINATQNLLNCTISQIRPKKIQEHNFKKHDSQKFYQCTNKGRGEQQQSQPADQGSQNSSDVSIDFYSIDKNSQKTINKNESKNSQKQSKLKTPVKNSQEKQDSAITGSNISQNNKKQKKIKYVRKEINADNTPVVKKSNQRYVLTKKLDKQKFSLNNFKQWIKHNKHLKIQDFCFQNQEKNIIVKLIDTNQFNNQEKLSSLDIYFKFSKAILLNDVSKEGISKIQQHFSGIGPQLQCKIVQGYKSPQTHEHKLRHMIIQNKIYKSSRNTQKFYAFWLCGLKPEVQKISRQISQYIEKLPKQNIKETMKLDIPQIQQYLHQQNVQEFAKRVIKKYFEDNNKFILTDVFLSTMKLTIKIQIKYQYYDKFTSEKRQKLNEEIKKCFQVKQILNESDMLPEFKEKYLLYPSKNPGKIVLVEQSSKATSTTLEIMNTIRQAQKNLKTVQISFKRGRLQLLKNFISSIQSDKNICSMVSNIKFTFEGDNKIQIIGTNKNINQLVSTINQYLAKLQQNTMEKILILNQQETAVVQKNLQKFKKQIQNLYKLSFNLSKDIEYGGMITLCSENSPNTNSPIIVYVQKHNQLSRLPRQTVICFQSKRDLEFSQQKKLMQIKAFFVLQKQKQLSEKQDTQKQFKYIFNEAFQTNQQIAECVYNKNTYINYNNQKNFAFIMPNSQKENFILDIIKGFEKLKSQKKIRIHILQQNTENIKLLLERVYNSYNKAEKMVRYYVFDHKELYYSASGDLKIKNALQRGKTKVELNNEDLNLQVITHKCNLKQKKIIHCQSGKQHMIQVHGNKCYIIINRNYYQMPSIQYNKAIKQSLNSDAVDVSIGFYQLDFVKMKQLNLFSGFQRDIRKKQIQVQNKKFNMFIKSDEKVNEIQVPFDLKQEQKAIKACQKIKLLIQSQKITSEYKLQKPISQQQYQSIRSIGVQNLIQVQYDKNLILKISSYDKQSISFLLKIVQQILSSVKQQIKYPQFWQDQNSEIQIFSVPKTTKQYQEIQKIFTISPIKQLIRIQNKLVFKKYHDQKIFLSQLNGKQVKQMMLFHGTRTTDPKIIFQDKEQSFNINYTSDNNFLGRGTYFAEKCLYSHSYAFVRTSIQEQNILTKVMKAMGSDQNIRQMFYCSVLVGDSQNVLKVDTKSQSMRDTQYKNEKQRIRYQSSTTFTNNSIIYAVYKNRRAYPHYLIRY